MRELKIIHRLSYWWLRKWELAVESRGLCNVIQTCVGLKSSHQVRFGFRSKFSDLRKTAARSLINLNPSCSIMDVRESYNPKCMSNFTPWSISESRSVCIRCTVPAGPVRFLTVDVISIPSFILAAYTTYVTYKPLLKHKFVWQCWKQRSCSWHWVSVFWVYQLAILRFWEGKCTKQTSNLLLRRSMNSVWNVWLCIWLWYKCIVSVSYSYIDKFLWCEVNFQSVFGSGLLWFSKMKTLNALLFIEIK